jgi:hypothetical protein
MKDCYSVLAEFYSAARIKQIIDCHKYDKGEIGLWAKRSLPNPLCFDHPQLLLLRQSAETSVVEKKDIMHVQEYTEYGFTSIIFKTKSGLHFYDTYIPYDTIMWNISRANMMHLTAEEGRCAYDPLHFKESDEKVLDEHDVIRSQYLAALMNSNPYIGNRIAIGFDRSSRKLLASG